MKSVEELMSSVDGEGEPPDGLTSPLLALWLTLHSVYNFCNLSISALVRFGLSCNSMNLV